MTPVVPKVLILLINARAKCGSQVPQIPIRLLGHIEILAHAVLAHHRKAPQHILLDTEILPEFPNVKDLRGILLMIKIIGNFPASPVQKQNKQTSDFIHQTLNGISRKKL